MSKYTNPKKHCTIKKQIQLKEQWGMKGEIRRKQKRKKAQI